MRSVVKKCMSLNITDEISPLAPASMHSLATDGEILLVAGVVKSRHLTAKNGKDYTLLYHNKTGGELW